MVKKVHTSNNHSAITADMKNDLFNVQRDILNVNNNAVARCFPIEKTNETDSVEDLIYEENRPSALKIFVKDRKVNNSSVETIKIECYGSIIMGPIVQNEETINFYGYIPIKPKLPSLQCPDMTVNIEEKQSGDLGNKSSHVRSRIKYHVCDICDKAFLRPSHVLRHKKGIHKIDVDTVHNKLSGKFQCRVCKNRFTTAQSRRRHEKNQHKFNPKYKQQLKCSECLSVFQSRKESLLHISEAHPNISMKTESLCFDSPKQFLGWKMMMENDTVSSYALVQGYQTKDYSIQQYNCRQSRHFKSFGKELVRKPSERNKIGFFCPANICVKTYAVEGNNICVTFLPTHMGHNSEVCKDVQGICMENNATADNDAVFFTDGLEIIVNNSDQEETCELEDTAILM